MYGPIALFLIMLVVATSGFQNIIARNNPLAEVFNIILTTTMLIVAATYGKKLGGAGSGAIMDTVNYGKKAGVWTGKTVGNSMYRISGLKNYMEERKKQKEKQEKKRSEDSWGTKRAQRDFMSPEKKAKLQEGTNNAKTASKDYAALSATAKRASLATDNRIEAQHLIKPEVVVNLSDDLFNDLVDNGSADQKKALSVGTALAKDLPGKRLDKLINNAISTRNPDLIRNVINNVNVVDKMSDEQKGKIINIGDTDLTNRLFRSINQASQKK